MGTRPAEQYNIAWHQHNNNLQFQFQRFLTSSRLVDVTLSCETEFFQCHRIILAACSPYFEQFFDQCPSTAHPLIHLKDAQAWEVKALLDFMYKGEVRIPHSRLKPVFRLAETLQIRGLCKEASDDEEEEDMLEEVDGSDDTPPRKIEAITNTSGTAQNQRPNLINRSNARSNLSQSHSTAVRSQQTQSSTSSNLTQSGATLNKISLPPLKRLLPSSGGPPKLVKMQKIDFPEERNSSQGTANGRNTPSPPTGSNKISKIVDESDEAVNVKKEDLSEDSSPEKSITYGSGGGAPTLDFEGLPHLGQDGMEGEEEDDYECVPETFEEDFDNTEGTRGSGSSDEIDQEEIITPKRTLITVGGRKVYKYERRERDQAVAALLGGLTIRQCSEQFDIPKKTLAKWRNQEIAAQAQNNCDDPERERDIEEELLIPEHPIPAKTPGVFYTDLPYTYPPKDAEDRGQRLKKAASLALAGVTVRQAAVHYYIPRTTLCAYMKRCGLHGSVRTRDR